jgi:hypothetical protein
MSTIITPADRSYVAVVKEVGCPAPAHCTVSHEGIVMGLRYYSVKQPIGIKHAIVQHSEGEDGEAAETPTSTTAPSVYRSMFIFESLLGERTVVLSAVPPGVNCYGFKAGVIASTTYSNGVRVVTSSSGFIKVFLSSHMTSISPDGEITRTYLGDCVSRQLITGPFSQDICYANGDRILVINQSRVVNTQNNDFYRKLLILSPTCCNYVNEGCISEKPLSTGVVLDWNIKQKIVDAQTDTEVNIFLDGRNVSRYADNIVECRFPDGTTTTLHKSGKVVVFEHPDMPTVEVNLEADIEARFHAKGGQVPLRRGADRVRYRMSCPYDGSAILVKYDTRVTAISRASITLVSRNRHTLVALDTGTVVYEPKSAWTDVKASAFSADATDNLLDSECLGFKPNETRGQALETIKKSVAMAVEDELTEDESMKSQYTFDLVSHSILVKDHEYNSFTVDPFSTETVTADLAGEIKDMKAEATFESAFETRAFIIQRDGNAVEVMSSSQMRNYQETLCDFESRSSGIAAIYGTDFGGSTQHFLQRRRRDLERTGCTFSDVYTARPWHASGRVEICPALQYAMSTFSQLSQKGDIGKSNKLDGQVVIERLLIAEHRPLSNEGELSLREDVSRWKNFCERRVGALDEFGVVDCRREEEIETEAAVRIRLKLLNKQMRAEKKSIPIETPSTNSVEEVVLDTKKRKGVLPEMLAGIEEGIEEEEDSFFEDEDYDDDSEQTDGEIVELNDAFDAYAHSVDGSDDPGYITSFRDLRGALIQILNRNISLTFLLNKLELEGIEHRAISNGMQSYKEHGSNLVTEVNINDEEFSRLFYRMRWENDDTTLQQTDGEGDASRSLASDLYFVPDDSCDLLTSTQDMLIKKPNFPMVPLSIGLKNIGANFQESEYFPVGSGVNAAKGARNVFTA